MNVYAIFDSMTGKYANVFLADNDMAAARAITSMFRAPDFDPDTIADFQLVGICALTSFELDADVSALGYAPGECVSVLFHQPLLQIYRAFMTTKEAHQKNLS